MFLLRNFQLALREVVLPCDCLFANVFPRSRKKRKGRLVYKMIAKRLSFNYFLRAMSLWKNFMKGFVYVGVPCLTRILTSCLIA